MGHCLSSSRSNGTTFRTEVSIKDRSGSIISLSDIDQFGQRIHSQMGPNYQSASLLRSLGLNGAAPTIYRMEVDPNTPFYDPSAVSSNYGRNYDKVTKVIAVYDYKNHVDGDICFRKGDVMILLDNK